MGVADLMGLEQFIGTRLTQEQRSVAVAALLRCIPVDHCSLVQTEAPQVGGSSQTTPP